MTPDKELDQAITNGAQTQVEVYLAPGQAAIVHFNHGTQHEQAERIHSGFIKEKVDRMISERERESGLLRDLRERLRRAESAVVQASMDHPALLESTVVESLQKQVHDLAVENKILRDRVERETFYKQGDSDEK